MTKRPMHVYCQQWVGPGRWCQTKAVAPDPRNPLTSSLCRKHLNEVTQRDSTPPRDDAREPANSVPNGGTVKETGGSLQDEARPESDLYGGSMEGPEEA